MAINWGAALGAAVGTGTKTYLQLQDEARQAEEFQWRQKEQSDKEKIAKAYTETHGQPEFSTEIVPNTERASDVGPAIDTRKKRYTQEQKAQDFTAKAAAMGVDPLKIQQAALGQQQLSVANSTAKRMRFEDEHGEWLTRATEQIRSGNVAEYVKENTDAVLKAYNEAKPGTRHGDGLTADIVPDATGNNYSFIQKDKSGKIVASTPITAEVAMAGLKEQAFQKYEALPGKFKEAQELGIKKEELAVKKEVSKSDILKNRAQAGAANMSAAIAGETLKDKRAVREAIRPFMDEYSKLTPAEQSGDKGQSLLENAEASAAIKFGDISALRKNSPAAKAEAGFERYYIESKKAADKEGEVFIPPDRAEYYGSVHGIASPEVVNIAQRRVDELAKEGKVKEAKAAVEKHNKIFYSPGSKIKLTE